MAECYLCRDYIAQGAGYRRSVQTGTSTRVYATRHGGASFGVYSGTRTLCATCAEMTDRLESGGALRVLALLVGWVISAIFGWKIVMSGDGGATLVVGLLFMLGIPVFVLLGLVEWQRRKAITEELFSRGNPAPIDIDTDLARRPGESIDAWVARAGPSDNEEARAVWVHFARLHPPEVGKPVSAWMGNWERWIKEEEAAQPTEQVEPVFTADDTIFTWAERASRYIQARTGEGEEEYRRWVIDTARYVKPQIGERLIAYSDRSRAWFEAFDRSIDPASQDAARRAGEPVADWVARVAPLCLSVDDGESIEDVIPKIIRIAELHPPFEREAAVAWLTRVAGPIAEMNRGA